MASKVTRTPSTAGLTLSGRSGDVIGVISLISVLKLLGPCHMDDVIHTRRV